MNRSLRAQDEKFMSQCLMLARKGAGYVSPNPVVGAVVVKNGKVLGIGYHTKFGGPHAEVNAIRLAKGSVRGATLYVNLEPCNYVGKTPPCTDLIISSKISRVVIGMKDPNPLVAGKGIRQLRQAGIQTTVGIFEDECRAINESFSKYIRTGLPFVTVKIAQTIDGKIADESGNSKWITGVQARKIVHILRSQYDAVLVGARTVYYDNPRLTVRTVKGRNPMRVVLDGRFTCRPGAKIFSPTNNTKRFIVVSRHYAERKPQLRSQFTNRGVGIIELQGDRRKGTISIKMLLRKLGAIGVSSLLVEGGAATFGAFINAGIVDKLMIFIAPNVMTKGLEAFAHVSRKSNIQMQGITIARVGNDVLVSGYLH